MKKEILLTLPLVGSLILNPLTLKAGEISQKMSLTFGGIGKYIKYKDKKVEKEGALTGIEANVIMPYKILLLSGSLQVSGGDIDKGKVFSSKDTKYRIETGIHVNPHHYFSVGLGPGYVNKDYDSISRKMKAFYPWISGSTFFEVGPFVVGPQVKVRVERGKVDKIDFNYEWKTGYEVGVLISDKKDKGIGNLMLYPFYLKDKTGSGEEKQAGVSIRFNF